MIVLVSDGMLSDGDQWLKDQIRLSGQKAAREMAEDICRTAQNRLGHTPPDDATVMVCRIQPQ